MRVAVHAVWWRLLVVIAVLVSALQPVAGKAASPADWDIPGGHFYTQASGQPGASAGFPITDAEGIPFWSEFKRLGGVTALGYPSSTRFLWDGFVVQATQRVVLQWRPEVGRVFFVNVLDSLRDLGKDDWLLTVRQVPKTANWSADTGQSWDAVASSHLAILDANPAIRARYFAVVGDPIQMNGLPMAPIADMGNVYVLRAQRVVIQQWKQNMPWAKAGEVTVALGGDMAKESGALPVAAQKPLAYEPALADMYLLEIGDTGEGWSGVDENRPERSLAIGALQANGLLSMEGDVHLRLSLTTAGWQRYWELAARQTAPTSWMEVRAEAIASSPRAVAALRQLLSNHPNAIPLSEFSPAGAAAELEGLIAVSDRSQTASQRVRLNRFGFYVAKRALKT